jgi:hypothetical protein
VTTEEKKYGLFGKRAGSNTKTITTHHDDGSRTEKQRVKSYFARDRDIHREYDANNNKVTKTSCLLFATGARGIVERAGSYGYQLVL